MPPRRNMRERRRNEESEDEDVEDNSIKRLLNSTMHPYEKTDFLDGGVLSPFQKALTYVINQHNGWATEEEILRFVRANWETINAMSSKKYTEYPSKRIIHLNVAIRKHDRPLFLKKQTNGGLLIGLPIVEEEDERDSADENNGESGKEGETTDNENYDHSEDNTDNVETPFEERILNVLRRAKESMDIDEITSRVLPFLSSKGLFEHIDKDRRIRACLLAMKEKGKVECDPETQKTWKYIRQVNKGKSDSDLKLPIKIKNLTLDELWNKLVQIGVY